MTASRCIRDVLCSVGMAIIFLAGPEMSQGGPPFPWRSRSMGPAPYSQPQRVPPLPRSRPTPPPVSSTQGNGLNTGARSRFSAPANEPTQFEPTPIDPDPLVNFPAKPFSTEGSPASPEKTGTNPPIVPRHRGQVNRLATLDTRGQALVVFIGRSFINGLVSLESDDAGPVRDCILGAQVVGSQRTETTLQVELLPDEQRAHLEFQLRGVCRNATENRTPQAVIQSEGYHRFEVAKSVVFDGTQILTRSPSAWIYPHQVNHGALTPMSAIPILGPLTSELALSIAERSRPASERITAQRITQQVVPKFNDSLDQRLVTLNSQLLDVLPRELPRLGIQPPQVTSRTTSQHLQIGLAWNEVAATSVLPFMLPDDAGHDDRLQLLVHQNAINAWLDRLPLEGLNFPVSELERWQTELRKELASRANPPRRELSQSEQSRVPKNRLSTLRLRPVSETSRSSDSNMNTNQTEQRTLSGFGEPTILGPILPAPTEEPVDSLPEQVEKIPAPEDELEPSARPADAPLFGTPSQSNGDADDMGTRMILADHHPVSVEWADGVGIVTINTAFQIPPAPPTEQYRIRIPLIANIEVDKVVVQPGEITVESLSTEPGALTEVMRATVQQQVRSRIQPTVWPLELPLPTRHVGPASTPESQEQKTGETPAEVRLRIAELTSSAGWLHLAWNVQGSANPQ